MNVLIVGSFPSSEEEIKNDDKLTEKFEEFKSSCRELGKILATNRATIFVGSDRSVDADTYVVEGANQAPLGANNAKHAVVVYTPDDWQRANPPFSDRMAELPNITADYCLVPGPWVKSTNSMMRRADVIMVIGGRGSTLQAGMAAPALGKPPVAIAAFGGAAQQVYEALCFSYAAAGLSGEGLAALSKPFTTSEDAEKIVKFSTELAARNPFRTKTGIWWRVAMLAVALFLIGSWVYVFGLGTERARQLGKNSPKTSQSADNKIEQANPGEAKPGEAKPGDANPGEAKPGEAKPGDAKPEDAKPGDAKPGDAKPGDAKPGDAKPGDAKPGDAKPGDAKPGDAKPGDAKPGDAKPGDAKPGDAKPGDAKTEGDDGAEPATVKLAQDPGEMTRYLIEILLISSTLGILFRTSVGLFRDQVIFLDDVINELTVGVLIAFSFLLLYLMGGLLYPGDTLSNTPESFRRVAIAVSVLGLASAFLLEGAVVEIRRRFGQVLRR